MNQDLAARLNGRRVVASISGGKDSASVSLWLTEQGIEHDRVFMDTGWESDITYEYLRGDLPKAIGPIQWIHAEKQMEDLIVAKAMFPSRTIRFCTEELKVFPLRRHLAVLIKAGHDVINTVGIRSDESAARSKMPEWEEWAWADGVDHVDCLVWRPLLAWTLQDVIDIHARHGLRPNPLYLAGASRVGCWPCIFARKKEIEMIARIDPARIDRLRVLEAKVADVRGARYLRDRTAWIDKPPPEPTPAFEATDGVAVETAKHERWRRTKERLIDRPFRAPAWFQAQAQSADGHYPMVPIDDVVKWSRTSRGGRQFEFFAAPARDTGCMRWGMCETATEDDS